MMVIGSYNVHLLDKKRITCSKDVHLHQNALESFSVLDVTHMSKFQKLNRDQHSVAILLS